MAIISEVNARWILDSRGLPTVQCTIVLDQKGRKVVGKASVPSGASTGTHEALELRDGENAFGGKGVNKAVNNIESVILSRILNRDFSDAAEVDQLILVLDGTEHKNNLGANAILAVSMAVHRSFANLFGLELWQYLRRLYFSSLPSTSKMPQLMCNVINGGVHADSGLSIQEFMVVPNTGQIDKDIQAASEIYQNLKHILKSQGQSISLGDEGGFAPKLRDSRQALQIIKQSVEQAGYSSLDTGLAIDAAANEFYNSETKTYTVDGVQYSQAGLTDFYRELLDEHHLLSIEDGYSEDDILGWEIVTQKLGSKLHLIGDDLFVTSPSRFESLGLKHSIANGVLIKLNQIGSVFETCDMINKAKDNNYITIVSHRSGETVDDFISDLAFASQSEYIKLGAPARGERVAKYNRLLDIFDSL
ncbi:MAG: phosphopyruvate hydratase [Patescibacteria group bacterium]